MFPKVDMCREINKEMLADLPSPTNEIEGTTLIDATVTICRKGDNLEEKVKKKLEELNKDVNNKGGLEANLKLVVGARVMLHCNVSVVEGLVNGALGTVQTISTTRTTVKFDRITNPFEIKQVKRKFMKQFPLLQFTNVRDCQ
uniref:DNA helicase Pif1-like 2B domain-containing protein n=1 Tax=Amphimedon queenslandica TaxID=400682 RepID=A0A1X7TPT6_AMPQE